MDASDQFAEVGLGEVVGGYRLDRLLGAGSTSHVFIGTHVRIGRQAAIKVLSQQLLDNKDVVSRLLQEARVVNNIRHPNIVEIIDFIETESPARVALVMEYIEGPSLKALREFPLSRDQALGIALQLVVAVQAAHEAGVIHRDIKPDNLLLTKDPRTERERRVPRLKIVDFGIAKLAGTSGKTVAGMMLGTPAYMAPEQVAGRPPPSAATDVFAIGEVLYELLTGQRAYPAVAIHETIRAKLRGELPKLELPPMAGDKQLLALITRCLALKPQDRPSLMEVRDSLLSLTPVQEERSQRIKRDPAAESIRQVLEPPTAQWLSSIQDEAPEPQANNETGQVTVAAVSAQDRPSTKSKSAKMEKADDVTRPPDAQMALARPGVATIPPQEFASPGGPLTEEVSRPDVQVKTEVAVRKPQIPLDDTSPTNRVIPALTDLPVSRAESVRIFGRDARGGSKSIPLTRELPRADSSRTDPPIELSEVERAEMRTEVPRDRDEHISFQEENITDLGDGEVESGNVRIPDDWHREGDSTDGRTEDAGRIVDSGEGPAADNWRDSQKAPAEVFKLGVGLLQPAGMGRNEEDAPSAGGRTPSTRLSRALESAPPGLSAPSTPVPPPPPPVSGAISAVSMSSFSVPGASSSIARPRPRTGTKPATIVLIAGLWLVASVLIYLTFTLGHDETLPLKPPVTTPQASSSSDPQQNTGAPGRSGRVVVNSEPKGARVEAADTHRLLGKTPLEIDPEQGPMPKRVRISADGYQAVEVDVTQSNTRIWVALEPSS